jgi:hypothetical protein
MPEMGCRRFHRRVRADETVRGQPYSRRHSKARLQNTSDEARDVRVVDICRDALGIGLVARAKVGLSCAELIRWIVERKCGETVNPCKNRRLRSRPAR